MATKSSRDLRRQLRRVRRREGQDRGEQQALCLRRRTARPRRCDREENRHRRREKHTNHRLELATWPGRVKRLDPLASVPRRPVGRTSQPCRKWWTPTASAETSIADRLTLIRPLLTCSRTTKTGANVAKTQASSPTPSPREDRWKSRRGVSQVLHLRSHPLTMPHRCASRPTYRA